MGEAYIELFSSAGCQDCDAVKKLLNQVIENFTGIDLEIVDIAEDSSRAEEYGIINVPSIVINGELKFIGEVPDQTELESLIRQELE
jgi:glutaredoxin